VVVAGGLAGELVSGLACVYKALSPQVLPMSVVFLVVGVVGAVGVVGTAAPAPSGQAKRAAAAAERKSLLFAPFFALHGVS